jgi:hypothetical protein
MNGNGLPAWKTQPSDALLRLHEAARDRGEDPFVTKVITVGTPTPPQPFVIPKPDWEAERIALREHERAARGRRSRSVARERHTTAGTGSARAEATQAVASGGRVITIIGEAFDPLGHRWNGRTIQTAELRSRQEQPVALTLDHTELAGRVLTLTRVKGGAVWGIAVAEGCDVLLEATDPIYFSPGTSTRADGSDGIILELALVSRTARVAARPVVIKAGDIRKPNDRGRWRLNGLAAELVPRAADELRCRPKDAPIHIRDLEAEKQRERDNRRATYVPPPLTRSNSVRGQQVPPQMRPGWKPGDIDWSMSGGQILSVR